MNEITFDNLETVPVRLPSNGSGKQGLIEVFIRPMTAQDERLLTNATLLRRGIVQDELLKRVILGGRSIDGEKVDTIIYGDLFGEDILALLLALRAISYGLDYDVEVRCPSCEARQKLELNIESDIDIEYAPEGFPFVHELVLPLSKRKVRYHYPLQRELSDNPLKVAANCVEEIEGVPKEAIDLFLSNLRAGDWAVIRNTITKPPFGVKRQIGYICDSCGEDVEVSLPIQASFFRIDT